jgi:hypothetical protein
VGFDGGEAVTEVGCGAVEGCAGKVMHQENDGAEYPAYLALKDVELGIAVEAEMEVEKLPNEESSDDPYSAGLCERGGGYGIDEGCGCALQLSPMLGEGEGGVKFNPEDPVGF